VASSLFLKKKLSENLHL